MIANATAACYSFVLGVRCIVSMVRGSVLFNKALAWTIFSCDQVDSSFTCVFRILVVTVSLLSSSEGSALRH